MVIRSARWPIASAAQRKTKCQVISSESSQGPEDGKQQPAEGRGVFHPRPQSIPPRLWRSYGDRGKPSCVGATPILPQCGDSQGTGQPLAGLVEAVLHFQGNDWKKRTMAPPGSGLRDKLKSRSPNGCRPQRGSSQTGATYRHRQTTPHPKTCFRGSRSTHRSADNPCIARAPSHCVTDDLGTNGCPLGRSFPLGVLCGETASGRLTGSVQHHSPACPDGTPPLPLSHCPYHPAFATSQST
jgi:hypothetical protein